MVHIILDQQNNKGLINITGDKEEVRTDFANFFEKLYEFTPDMFLELLDILKVFTIHLQEEELKKNDQNNSSNESRE